MGTNRYAYANNDPVNKLDPNGNFLGSLLAGMFFKAIGLGNLFQGVMAVYSGIQTVQALRNGASVGDVLKSLAINYAVRLAVGAASQAISSGQPQATHTFAGGPESSYAVDESGFFSRNFGVKLKLMNPKMLASEPVLAELWASPTARAHMYSLLKQGNYLSGSVAKKIETGGWFVLNHGNGSVRFIQSTGDASWNSIALNSPPSITGLVSYAHVHTHPASGQRLGFGMSSQLSWPSSADIAGALHFGKPGFVVNRLGEVFAYNGNGF